MLTDVLKFYTLFLRSEMFLFPFEAQRSYKIVLIKRKVYRNNYVNTMQNSPKLRHLIRQFRQKLKSCLYRLGIFNEFLCCEGINIRILKYSRKLTSGSLTSARIAFSRIFLWHFGRIYFREFPNLGTFRRESQMLEIFKLFTHFLFYKNYFHKNHKAQIQ